MSPYIKVLVVEDDALNQELFRVMLEHQGCAVDFADNGKDGIKAVANGNYDVVLMDIRLPKMGGIKATEGIRALEGPKRKTPVIAMTANAMVGDREEYLAAGMDDYVSKPFTMTTLAKVIQRWCPNDAEAGSNTAGRAS